MTSRSCRLAVLLLPVALAALTACGDGEVVAAATVGEDGALTFRPGDFSGNDPVTFSRA